MKNKIVKWSLILMTAGIVVGGGVGLYIFNMPHRDIQSVPVDYQLTAKQIVSEYLDNAQKANDKYLQEEGDSKIIAVTGTVLSIDMDMKGQHVVLLKDKGENAGVSCTFMSNTNANAENLTKGVTVTIKGVIRSGAGYDEDLEIFEDVILEKCDVIHG